MDWNALFNIVLIPILGALTTYVILFINVKKKELQERYDNEVLNKYTN